MDHLRVLDVRWLWRYRLFFVAAIIVLSVQVFVGAIFFTLYTEIDKNTGHSYSKSEFFEQNKLNKRFMKTEYRNPKKTDDSHYEGKENSHKLSYSSNSGLSVVCNVSNREAVLAVNRAKTSYCKQLILNTTCNLTHNKLFPEKLPHSCPANGLVASKYLGCFRDTHSPRLLNGAYYNSSKLNSPSHCLKQCLRAGFPYAGVQFADECFCGNKEPPAESQLSETQCNYPCPANYSLICGGYFTVNIYETGVAKFTSQIANEVSTYVKSPNNSPVRIVFLLTLNGRAVRQVHRLIKLLFHKDHFFFIHVDGRQDFMFRELLSLEMRLSNVRLSRRRHNSIWGGASLLTMLLESMSELIQSSWDWDFIINLSESDFPIKTNEELVAFLSVNRNRNFVKSHGRDVHHFIHKQGLDKTFVECDEHMWRIGNKALPLGIVIDGGSDWVALSRPFVNYIVTAENDLLLNGLKIVFKYTLLPAESFFHTVLRNSIFCDTYIDNNLHVTNWKRHLGCKCQYKHVVDWCGCSPNVFTLDDWSRIHATVNKSLYFARKFDPIVSQQVINRVSEWLYGQYSDEFNSDKKYWQNIFHHLDTSPAPDDAIVAVSSSLCRRLLSLLLHNDLMCSDLFFEQLLQVHVFYEDDKQKGFLVLCDAHLAANISVNYEVFYEKVSSFKILNSSPVAVRFLSAVVNTNFDAKEQISRNYMGAIGPYSEPGLIYQVGSGPATSNVTVAWMSPFHNLADAYDIFINEMTGVFFSKANLKTPLFPGKWSVYLIHNGEVFMDVTFVVTPLENINGKPLSLTQARKVHGGLESSVTHEGWDYIIQLIEDTYLEMEPVVSKEEAAQKSSFIDEDLDKWIDDVNAKSFNMRDFCITEKKKKTGIKNCFHKNFQYCEKSSWSSFSPDPKTHITTVNKLTGRLN